MKLHHHGKLGVVETDDKCNVRERHAAPPHGPHLAHRDGAYGGSFCQVKRRSAYGERSQRQLRETELGAQEFVLEKTIDNTLAKTIAAGRRDIDVPANRTLYPDDTAISQKAIRYFFLFA